MRLIVPVLVGLLLQGFSADAEEFTVRAIDFAPLSMQTKDGKIGGVGVEIIAEMKKRAGFETKESLIPVGKMVAASEAEIALFPLVIRNKEREDKFRWIGKMTDDHFCMLALKSKGDLSNLEAVKKLKSVGVNQGGSSEILFDKLGLSNKEIAVGNAGNVRKLFGEKIEAWFTGDLIGRYSVGYEGFDTSKINCSGDFAKISLWVAASKKMSEESFEKIKSTYTALEKEGFVAATVKKYQPK